MKYINITPTQEKLIQDICVLEHESLLRLHSGNSQISDTLMEQLEDNDMTMDDYLDYSSDMYYDFQKVLENPKLIEDQKPLFYMVFLEVCKHWEPWLIPEYGDHLKDLADAIKALIPLKVSSINNN